MSKSYTPQQGSVAWKVIEFFTTNPQEELTLADLESKFDKAASQFHSLLGAAVDAGVLKRSTNDDDELVYSIGNGHPQVGVSKARNPSLRPDALLAGAALGKRKALAVLDLDAIPLRSDVPLPDRGGRKVDWSKLFKRMAVGQSCVLPIALRGSLNKACTEAKIAGLGEFAIRGDTDETVAVWRTA